MNNKYGGRFKQISVTVKLLCGVLGILLFSLISNVDVVKAEGAYILNENTTLTAEYLSDMFGTLHYNEVNLNGHTLRVTGGGISCSVPIKTGNGGQLIIEDGGLIYTGGDLSVDDDGVLDIGGKMTVKKGRVILRTNTMLIVHGDMEFANEGSMYASNQTSKISVGGNFNHTSVGSVANNAGEWTIAGNITMSDTAGNLEFKNLKLT